MRKTDVDRAVMALACRNRERAVAVLAKFGVRCTPELRREDYPAVIELATQELQLIDPGARAPVSRSPAPRGASPGSSVDKAVNKSGNLNFICFSFHWSDNKGAENYCAVYSSTVSH